MPDTWVPTVTVSTGSILPVAVTLWAIYPVSGFWVWITTGASVLWINKNQVSTIAISIAAIINILFKTGFMIASDYSLIGTPL
jgi:hypothetical protein